MAALDNINLIRWAKTRLIAFRDNLYYVSEIFPTMSFIGNTIIALHWGIYALHNWYYGYELSNAEMAIFGWVQFLIKHYVDSSLIFILMMFAYSKHYSKVSWLMLLASTYMWALNSLYILFNFDTDLYYGLHLIAIYVIVIIFGLIFVTNRRFRLSDKDN